MTKSPAVPETISGTFLYLTVGDRNNLITILPEKDSIGNLSICEDISEKVQITALDKTRVNWRPMMRPTGKESVISGQPEMAMVGWEWDKERDQEVEFKFTSSETRLLKEIVTKLDEHRGITRANLSVCRKIAESRPGVRRPDEVVDAIVEDPEDTKTE